MAELADQEVQILGHLVEKEEKHEKEEEAVETLKGDEEKLEKQ